MQIVVNHLTRMQQGYICVAGLDLRTGRHIRPVLPHQRLGIDLLARHGGPFDIGAIVDLGSPVPNPQPPEVEDHDFDPAQAKAVRYSSPSKFWGILEQVARPRFTEIFGAALTRRGSKSCAVDVGQGIASLGCVVPNERPTLYIQPQSGRRDQIRMQVTDGELDLDLGVTDIRLYGDDHVSPDPDAIKRIAASSRGKAALVLGVGLTRAYASSPDFAPVHWLQINNIHVESDPGWRLG